MRLLSGTGVLGQRDGEVGRFAVEMNVVCVMVG